MSEQILDFRSFLNNVLILFSMYKSSRVQMVLTGCWDKKIEERGDALNPQPFYVVFSHYSNLCTKMVSD